MEPALIKSQEQEPRYAAAISVASTFSHKEVRARRIQLATVPDWFLDLEESLRGSYRSVFKQSLDFVLVMITLPLWLPLSVLTALAIKLDSRGPAIFCQNRTGLNGKSFKMYKFRSMVTDAESSGAKFATKNDERVTRVGKFIRKLRLDELPQFWNVLNGDMSLIGPRPEQVKFVEEFRKTIPFYDLRHRVRPGITGWAQVHYGYCADATETSRKLEFDLYYVKNVSFVMDTIIFLKTIRTILTGFGAR